MDLMIVARRLLIRKYYFVGLILVGLSFLHWYFPLTRRSVAISHVAFCIGNILIFDYISQRFSQRSLIKDIGKINVSIFVITTVIFSVIFEIYARWIAKIWYWPFLDSSLYLVVFIPGAIIYGFYLTEMYLGIKAVLSSKIAKKIKGKIAEKIHKFLCLLLIVAGLGFVFVFLFLLYWQINLGGLEYLLKANLIPKNQSSNFLGLLVGGLLLWVFLDLLEYYNYRSSMIVDAFRGNPVGILSGIGSGFLGALTYEYFNLYAGLWRYANFPFENIVFSGIPLVTFLVWPIPILVQISIFRIFLNKWRSSRGGKKIAESYF